MSKYKKFALPLIILLAILVVVFTGKAFSTKTAAAKDNRTEVVFWHEMGGPAEKSLMKVVDGFNKSQTKYRVVPKYQGSYDAAIQKILQTHGTSTSPAVFQAFDISAAQMMHSKFTTPVQKFIDADNFDVSKISPVARSFYSDKGKQQAMPFNTSQTVLYYNASLLEKYGITPPPVSPTYSDITRVAKEIYEKSNHQVKGMTVQIYGWLLEQAMANAGVSLTNNNDGHTGIPTKATINNKAAKEFFEWIRENQKNGDFISYGSGAMAGTNQTTSFLNGKLGIYMQSSASMSQLNKKNKNKLGITYFPHPDGQKANGVAIGGAALWISNDKPKDVQQGAFEFIKYSLKPEVQAQWQKDTGYLALNKDSQQTKILKDLYKKHPEARVPSQQLQEAVPNNFNSGILMEGMQKTRQIEQFAMESIYNGGDIVKALKDADKKIDENLTTTNRANGYH
ncbi:ABC transporter substrate-binding protein [Companilactobacillus suantsaicola]|uniref:ABC transporter substrate-binding protein n=1 Tax=Companilactobacillus suantsaicola TaxID=2487723 RepID=A0A4Z0JEX1_9LACO|nr:ABC transporter substrate-binding protein [Companilactobacillus suantsaicola]TGD21371.1 ABC transporter substrate-binding protein [Companilactobacillus suantsaicola]